MADNVAVGPLTHTVSYAGHRIPVVYEQAARILQAMDEARVGLHTLIGAPVTAADTGQTEGRYLLIGPGIPVLIEGPLIEESPLTMPGA